MKTYYARRAAALAAAASATLLVASSAHADSISFVKGGDIWVTSTDGANQVQLTHDGGYSYASRADDGSFIALHGRRLHRLSPTGALLADFSTPVSGEQTAPNTSYFQGPYKPEISPDGTKVAYEYWHQEVLSDPGCAPVGTPWCTGHRVSTGIGYSYSDRMTAWDEPGLGYQSGWVDPSWIDNSTLLQSYKSVRPNVDAIIDHPGDGEQTIQEWFEDTNAWYLKDGEVSRRGDAAAFVSGKPRDASDPLIGQEDDQVTIYAMHGAAPALPEQCFSFHNDQLEYAGPTFSPDGAHIAFAVKHRETHALSLVVADIPSQAAGCQLPTSGGKVIVTDATDPDWSPAPVPVLPAGGGSAGGAGGGASGGGAATGSGGSGAGSAVSGTPSSGTPGEGTPAARGLAFNASKGALRKAAAGRLALTATLPGAGRVKITARVNGKAIGTASARSKKARDVQLRVTVGRAARASFAGRSATVTISYRFTPQHGAPVDGQATVTISR